MALPTVLSLVIKARDEATGVVNRFAGNLQKAMQTGQALKQGGSTGNALADQMGGAVLKANLMSMALEKGFSFAHQKAMELKAAMGGIAQMQMQNLSAANSLKSVTGLSMQEAKSTMTELTTELAKAASSQPGSTDDYLMIFRQTQDNIAKAFVENGKLNKEAFKQNAVGLAADFGSVAATSGTNSMATSMWLSRALGGASVAQLKDLEFGMNNPTVMNMIEEKLNEAGVKGLNELTDAQRVALLVSVGKVVNSDEMKREGAKTIDGMWQSFHDKLFGSQGGMFTGFFKNLDKTGKTDMSVAAAFTDAVAAVIGEGGLFDQLGKMFTKITGITADTPMELLRAGIVKFTVLAAIINHNLSRANQAMADGAGFFEAIGDSFGGLASRFAASFGTPEEIGEKLAGVVNSVFNALFSGLLGVAQGGGGGDTGAAIAGVVGGFLRGFGSFLANLDPAVYSAIAIGILLPSVASAVTTFAAGLMAVIITATAAATAGLPVILVVAAGLALGAFAKAVIDNWQTISEMAGGILGDIGKAFVSYFSIVKAVFTGDFNGAIQGAKDLVAAVTAWFNRMRDTWATLTGGKTTGQQAAEKTADRAEQLYQQAAANKRQEKEAALVAAAVNPVAQEISGPAMPPLTSYVQGPPVPAAAMFAGHVPVVAKFMGGLPVIAAAGGLLNAVAQEAANKPPGSGLVVANTSEFILRPDQMARLMQGSASVGAGVASPLAGANVTFAPQFIMGAQTDVEELAREVLRYFEIFLDETINSQLTT